MKSQSVRPATAGPRALIATAIAAACLGGTAAAEIPRARDAASPSPVSSAGGHSRPDKADWEKIKAAARLRSLALAPHRTAHFRAFAAYLGLSELFSIRPLTPGRCQIAVTYLRNNLRDLENAFPGENWDPLRRAVAREPSIRACAPPPANQPDRSVRSIVARASAVT